MNDIESRLSEAMAARAREVEPGDDATALGRITKRVDDRRRRALVVLGVAAALAVVIGAVTLVGRDGGGKKVNVTTDTSTTASTPTTPTTPTTSSPTTTTTPTSISVVPSPTYTAIWPFDPGQAFATPEQAAKTFAVDYLGMTLATVGSKQGYTGEVTGVEIFPNDRSTTRTVVQTTRDATGHWVVIGAAADEIQIDQPAVGAPLTSPLEVSGQSTAFEAQIALELRPHGTTESVAAATAMGGSNGEMGPFSTTITPPSTDEPLVLIVYEADASDRGKMTKATVIPLEGVAPTQPTTFVGWTTDGTLMLLDFDGHLQREIATAVAPDSTTVAYAPAEGAIGYGDQDDGQSSCGRSIFHRDENGRGISTSYIPGADRPTFSYDGREAYVTCDGEIFDHFAAPGEQGLTPPGSPQPVGLTFVGTDVVAAFADGTVQMAATGRVLPVNSTVVAGRGRLGTLAFWDGTFISSYDPATGEVVQLVQPPAAPVSLDADDSGHHLLWVDVNHTLWKWSGTDVQQVAVGFNSAAW